VLLGPEVEAEAEAHGAALEGVGGGVLEAGAVVGPVVDVADVADLLDPDLVAVDGAGEAPDATDHDVVEGGGPGPAAAAARAGVGSHLGDVAADHLDELEVEGADDAQQALVDDVVGDVVLAVLALDEIGGEGAGELDQVGVDGDRHKPQSFGKRLLRCPSVTGTCDNSGGPWGPRNAPVPGPSETGPRPVRSTPRRCLAVRPRTRMVLA
jgi:hypothetical protein